MELSEKLYNLRKKQGLSQEQLAEQLNVSRQAVFKWESGTAIPKLKSLHLIPKQFFRASFYVPEVFLPYAFGDYSLFCARKAPNSLVHLL